MCLIKISKGHKKCIVKKSVGTVSGVELNRFIRKTVQRKARQIHCQLRGNMYIKRTS